MKKVMSEEERKERNRNYFYKWRKKNPERAQEILLKYWKKRLEKENEGKENEDEQP